MKFLWLLISLFSATVLAEAGADAEATFDLEERQACVPGQPVFNNAPRATLLRQFKLFAVNPRQANSPRYPVGSPLNPLPDTFQFPFKTFPLTSKQGGIYQLQNNQLYGNGGVLSTNSNSSSVLQLAPLVLSQDSRTTSVAVQSANVCNGAGKIVRGLVFVGPVGQGLNFGSAVTKTALGPQRPLFKPALPILNPNEVNLEIVLV